MKIRFSQHRDYYINIRPPTVGVWTNRKARMDQVQPMSGEEWVQVN